MKKSLIIISIFLSLSFSANTTITIAQTTSSTASEGFYNIQDLKLLPDVMYNVSNKSGLMSLWLSLMLNKLYNNLYVMNQIQ